MREANQAKGVLAGCVAVMLLGVQLAATAPRRRQRGPGDQRSDGVQPQDQGRPAGPVRRLDRDLQRRGLRPSISAACISPTTWIRRRNGRFPRTIRPRRPSPPGGYLLIWADGSTGNPGLHASFKLDAGGRGGRPVRRRRDDPARQHDLPHAGLRCLLRPQRRRRRRNGGSSRPRRRGPQNQGGYEGCVGKIEFSREHGFYEEPFSVTLTTDDAGGDDLLHPRRRDARPDAGTGVSGTVYTGPIPIEKTTCLRAAAIKEGLKPSAVHTQTYIFVSDVIQQSPTGAKPGPGWPEPDAGTPNPYSFSGGPQVIDYGMDPDVVNDPRYKDLVDDALLSIPTISLVTPLANLFDPTDGDLRQRPGGRARLGAAGLRGADRIRTGPRGSRSMRACGFAGATAASATIAKHGFRLFFRAEYGASELHYPLFGEEGVDTFEKIDLRAEQNYSWAYRGDLGDRPRRPEHHAPRRLLPRPAGGHRPALYEKPILPSLHRRPVSRDLSDARAIRGSLRGILLRRGQRGLRRDQSRCRPRSDPTPCRPRTAPSTPTSDSGTPPAQGFAPDCGLLSRAGSQLGRHPQPRLRAARRRRQPHRLHDLHAISKAISTPRSPASSRTASRTTSTRSTTARTRTASSSSGTTASTPCSTSTRTGRVPTPPGRKSSTSTRSGCTTSSWPTPSTGCVSPTACTGTSSTTAR